MFIVREARPDDATAVVPFLVNALKGRAESYQSIFAFAQSRIGLAGDDTERPLGAVLQRTDGSVAGFLGVLASRQPHLTPGWVQHLTGWAVAADAPGQGLRLLNHVALARPGILTNFSATPAVQTILPAFGFKPVDEAELTFSSWSFAGARNRLSGKVATGAEATGFAASSEQSRIVRDHLTIGCHAIATEQGGRKIVVVLLRLGRGNRATAQLIHLSPTDDDAIAAIWPSLQGFALFDMRCSNIRMDARYAPRGEPPMARKPRQMLAKNFSGSSRELTRAFGEPLNAWARFGLSPQKT